jgi:hypothetical protein
MLALLRVVSWFHALSHRVSLAAQNDRYQEPELELTEGALP